MSDDPLKEMLFELLESGEARRMAESGECEAMVDYVMSGCMDRAQQMVPYEEAAVALSTGLLHYVLSVSGIPSQRKVACGGVDVDIVLPGARRLREDPSSALIIQVCGSCDAARRRLDDSAAIQPVSANIWALAPRCSGPRHYSMFGGPPNIATLIRDMTEFSRSRRQHRLGLVR